MNDSRYSNCGFVPTALLVMFLGTFGVHRFYVGKYGTGILMLLTFGGLGIWALIDYIIIITDGFTDGEGRIISRNQQIQPTSSKGFVPAFLLCAFLGVFGFSPLLCGQDRHRHSDAPHLRRSRNLDPHRLDHAPHRRLPR